MNYLKTVFIAGLSLLICGYVHAETTAETNANSDSGKTNQTLQSSDLTIININLKKYEMVVEQNGKSIATYPVSWGGPDAMPKCDPKANKGRCPTSPRECLGFSHPPSGEFQVKSAKDMYHSHTLNSDYSNVIWFGESGVIRAVNRSAPSAAVGGAQFTCGHIVLRTADAKSLRQRISSSDPKFFKVRVSN